MRIRNTIMRTCLKFVLLLGIAAGAFGQDLDALRTPEALRSAPFRNARLSAEERAMDLLMRMTQEEKLGQMTLVGRAFLLNKQDIADYYFGALLSGGGSSPKPNNTKNWAKMIEEFQDIAESTPLSIPLLYGSDAVHGHNNLLNATIFPHHIGMGAANDPELMRRVGTITAEEMRASGVNWNFSPAISVPQDIRWGRTYEGFSSDPDIVGALGKAEIEGLQDSNLPIIATAKHFVADGGTRAGRDRGNSIITQEVLEEVHLAPYYDAIDADVAVIMASYSSVNSEKMHGHKELMTDLLKDEIGFDGFIVSDWDAIEELGGTLLSQVVSGINAGIDMVMVPDEYIEFLDALTTAVEQELITEERIDDAVYRILRIKFKHGIFDTKPSDPRLVSQVGSKQHRKVAREAVAKSLVLLKNEEQALPFTRSTRRILVVGDLADDIGGQSGGWTIEWQGKLGDITEGTTVLEAITQRAGSRATVDYAKTAEEIQALAGNEYDRVVAVVGETPYAEGEGDSTFPFVSTEQTALISAAKEFEVPIVTIVISGRPILLESALNDSDAIVAAWLPGTEGAGISDVLWNDKPFSGTLPFVWPENPRGFVHGRGSALFERGFGLKY